MSNELVNRLRRVLSEFSIRLPHNAVGAISDAITFIYSQDSVRDRALDDPRTRHAICNWLFSYNDQDPRQEDGYDVEAEYGQDADDLLKRLRVLKSAPAPVVECETAMTDSSATKSGSGTSDSTAGELLPCPFCGATPRWVDGSRVFAGELRCSCGAVFEDTGIKSSTMLAWNTRAALTPEKVKP